MRTSEREVRGAGYLGLGVAAALATAGLVFLFDPVSGNRRRALLRDKWHRAQNQSRDFLGKASRDATQRARGLYRGAQSRLRRAEIDDERLEQRVRSELGRLISHPRAIQVQCRDGFACLRGDVLESEANALLRGVGLVAGVKGVDDQLQRHASGEGVPSLQGGGKRQPLQRFEYLQSSWSPAPRLAAGTAALGLIASAFARRSPLAYALAGGGALLLSRAISNTPLTELMGVRPSDETDAQDIAGGVWIQKSIEVYADVDEVYSCWRNLEQLPQFMAHVREVHKLDDKRYHWVVDGPAGVPVEWDAEITADVPNELIAWRTVEGSAVQSSGFVQFDPSRYGGTRVQVRMSYRPPASAIGHTIAKIFGRDPRTQMDEDLLRFKTFIEQRVPPRDAASQEMRH